MARVVRKFKNPEANRAGVAKNRAEVSVLMQNNTRIYHGRCLSSRRQIPASFLGLMVNERTV